MWYLMISLEPLLSNCPPDEAIGCRNNVVYGFRNALRSRRQIHAPKTPGAAAAELPDQLECPRRGACRLPAASGQHRPEASAGAGRRMRLWRPVDRHGASRGLGEGGGR